MSCPSLLLQHIPLPRRWGCLADLNCRGNINLRILPYNLNRKAAKIIPKGDEALIRRLSLMENDQVPVGKFGYVQRKTLDWFSAHLNVAIIGSIATLTLLFSAGKFLGWFRGDSQVDFVAAQIAYHKWNGSLEALGRLEKLIRRHPELHAKYDGPIAQKLLSSSERGLGHSYAKSVLKRTSGFSPHYTAFAKGSLLIAEGKLSEALTIAKELKVNMESDTPFWEKRSKIVRHGSLLYAYNLLRIATLEKAAGSPQGELLAWQEFKKNAGWQGEQQATQTYDPEAYQLIQQNFQKQATSLWDYIQHREEMLISSEKSR
jgi:hypothetical protein